MKIGVAATAALLAILPLSASPSKQPEPPRLVSSSEHGVAPITIPLIDPHYPANAAEQATALFNDVNAERVKRGLAPLERDETLDRFAYAKAIEMAARGYFGHTDPNGITFQDRLRTWRWPTPYAAENIAFDWDETRAHAAFMNSPPHAQNLLDRNERKMGVAVVNVGDRQNFYVQDFSGQ